jgi:hypothetical protein
MSNCKCESCPDRDRIETDEEGRQTWCYRLQGSVILNDEPPLCEPENSEQLDLPIG